MGIWQFPGLIALALVIVFFIMVVSIIYLVFAIKRWRARAKVDVEPSSVSAQNPSTPRDKVEPFEAESKVESKPDSSASLPSGCGSGFADGLPPHAEQVPDFVPETIPRELTYQPLRLMYGISLIAMIVLILVELIVFFGWSVKKYYVWDRVANARLEEFQPKVVAKSLLLMYSWDSLATDLNYNVFCDVLTSYCGTKFRSSDSKGDIKSDFIDKYSIDMSQYSPSDYTQYESANAWFIRGLATGARPISSTSNACIAPADGRVLVFSNIWTTARFWIKSNRVDTTELLDSASLAADFNGGTLMIYRLAPQDYHRFHSPVAGTIDSIKSVGGTLFSVSADAAKSKNAAFLNQRQVVMITSPTFGKVAFVAIGATCVGSVVMTQTAGSTIQKGDELGYMQFGGSTVVVLYKAGEVTIDADLVYNSGKQVETYLQMGTHNGVG